MSTSNTFPETVKMAVEEGNLPVSVAEPMRRLHKLLEPGKYNEISGARAAAFAKAFRDFYSAIRTVRSDNIPEPFWDSLRAVLALPKLWHIALDVCPSLRTPADEIHDIQNNNASIDRLISITQQMRQIAPESLASSLDGRLIFDLPEQSTPKLQGKQTSKIHQAASKTGSYFRSATETGLWNAGNTCYVVSLIQMLLAITGYIGAVKKAHEGGDANAISRFSACIGPEFVLTLIHRKWTGHCPRALEQPGS